MTTATLDSILDNFAVRVSGLHNCPRCLDKDQAKSAILDLFKRCVPEEREIQDTNSLAVGMINISNAGHNSCRKLMLDRLEEMSK